jgi:hypothetical protein
VSFDWGGTANYTLDFLDKLIYQMVNLKENTLRFRFASGGVSLNTHQHIDKDGNVKETNTNHTYFNGS